MLSRLEIFEQLDAVCKPLGVVMTVNSRKLDALNHWRENIEFEAPFNNHFVFDPIYKKWPKKTICWNERNLISIIPWVKTYLSCLQEGEPITDK
jgi:hypothetical protein